MDTAIMVITLTIGIVILAADYKTESTRYLSFMFFCAALSAFASVSDRLVGFLIQNGTHLPYPTLSNWLWFNNLCNKFTEHYSVFFLVMYCVSYSKLLKRSQKIWVAIFLILLISTCFFSTTVKSNDSRWIDGTYAYYFQVLSIFYIPCILFSMALLWYAYIKEKNPGIKIQRRANLVISNLILLSVMFHLLILRALGVRSAAWLNGIALLFVFMLYLFFLFGQGAFGIRLRVERVGFNPALESISYGTAVFNHSLKNEVNKISVISSNIKRVFNKYLPSMDSEDVSSLDTNISILENSTGYLRLTVDRLKNFSENIRLLESVHPLSADVQQALLNAKPFLLEKNIAVEGNYDEFSIHIKSDSHHFAEVLTNIIKNACEALDRNGCINIQVYGGTKLLYLSVADNGPGIKKEYLPRVFDPFFSTRKEGSGNFGIGLAYCCRVLQRHQCDINIYSKEGDGTTVVISIPGFRIHCLDKDLPERST